MVKYEKEEKRLIIPADINYYSLEEYKRGYQEGYEDGYASGITACTPDYSKEYLTIEALETGDFYVRSANIGYSVNEGNWEKTSGATTISLSNGDTVRFRGTSWGFSLFSGNTLAFNAYGNVESLRYSDNFEGKTGITASALTKLFRNSSGLVDASNLILPATALAQSCYSYMFNSCTSLTKAPAIPATTLANGCYQSMFAGCTSLTTAPELPATTLAENCYALMFEGCSNLTTAPNLPATTLAAVCYGTMFSKCTNLTTAPSLPATTLAVACYSMMFDGCKKLTTAPELPATTLVDTCYSYMFADCQNLNYIKCLATDISERNGLQLWTRGVSPTGTFVTPSITAWETGDSGIPYGWTRVDA